MKPRPCILYLHAKVFNAGITNAELTGIRRHATAHGWEVREVALDEKRLAPALRAAFCRFRPLGCVVQSGGRLNPPPRLFGDIPAVYIDPPRDLRRKGVARVAMDNAEIARFAFRELMSGRPEALAFIGGRWSRIWSRERGSAFAALAREARLPFFPFPHRRESDAERDARLHAFVRGLPPRCGIFCATDQTAADVSGFAIAEHRRVPHDLTFVGVNDIDQIWKPPAPSVTSVRLDFERFGYEAAKMLGKLVSRRAAEAQSPPKNRGEASRVSGEQISVWNKALCGSASLRESKIATVGPLMVTRRDSTRGRGRRKPDILKAVEMIRAEACDGLTAAALAARFPGSRRLFDLRFREAMGHPAHDEILHVRLERALSLLARPEVPIGAIYFQCGFRSEIALHKLFTRRYGLSMRQWRKEHAN